VYIITKLLPKLLVNVDVLLTTDEELGQSTASSFNPRKKYNWGVEFDRGGDDVVLYDYDDNKSWQHRLERSGFKIGMGTFSDISCMEDIGCSFVNVGVGYHMAHTTRSFLSLDEMMTNLAKFLVFYDDNKEKKFKHEAIHYDYDYNGSPYLKDWSYVYDNKKEDDKWDREWRQYQIEAGITDEDELTFDDDDDIDIEWMDGQ
jgi:hypothetical protein